MPILESQLESNRRNLPIRVGMQEFKDDQRDGTRVAGTDLDSGGE